MTSVSSAVLEQAFHTSCKKGQVDGVKKAIAEGVDVEAAGLADEGEPTDSIPALLRKSM